MAAIPGVQTTRQVINPGSGPKPQKGQSVTVNCTGTVLQADGSTKKFWSTKDPGQQPFTFKAGLGQVIKGWDAGVMEMCQGETSKLTIPGHEGYGANGFPAWGWSERYLDTYGVFTLISTQRLRPKSITMGTTRQKKSELIPANATLVFEIEVVSIQ